MCPRRDSNSYRWYRKPKFYPLNYGDNCFSSACKNRKQIWIIKPYGIYKVEQLKKTIIFCLIAQFFKNKKAFLQQ